MKGEFRLLRTDDMDATFTITMKMREWKELRQQITSKYPGWKFASMIDRLIIRSTAYFEEECDADGDG